MKFANDIEELVYLEYQEIEQGAYQERIRYFERNKKAISSLSYELRLEMSLEYTVALFEVGDYSAYLKYVDQLLNKVIEENIYSIDGDDIYQELLFRKAASLHNLVEFRRADYILSELNRIAPDNEIYKRTFIKNSVGYLRYLGQKVRGGIIALFLLAGLVIGVELLIIRPFFPEFIALIEQGRHVILGSAIFGIIFQELRIRYISWSRLRKLNN